MQPQKIIIILPINVKKMHKRIQSTVMLLFAAVAILSSTSCEKKPTTDNQDAIMVNVAALYDELGIRNEMAQMLANGSCVITDTLLIYDASGRLVSKLGAESNSLKPLTFNAEGLSDGNYTLVLWQTARSSSGDRGWRLTGEEQLSTAILNQLHSPLDYIFSAGYASTTVATEGGKLVPTLTPMAIGSIVDMRVDNLSVSPANTALSLWGTNYNYYTGIRLSPAVDESVRYYTSPDSSLSGRIAQVPVDQNNGKFFTLYHGKEIYLELWVDKGTSEKYVTFIDAPFNIGSHAVCYLDMSRSIWQPPYFGSEGGFAAWKADRDAGILVTDPLLQWGCNYTDVQQHMSAKNWWDWGSYEFEFWEDPFQSWHIWYSVSPAALTEQYLFETENGQNLRYVVCYCWDETVPLTMRDNLLQHQGFQSAGTTTIWGDSFSRFLSADGQTEALTTVDDEGYWFIIYRPVSSKMKAGGSFRAIRPQWSSRTRFNQKIRFKK